MDNKIILSANRPMEPTSFGKIVHSYSNKFRSLPKAKPFKSLLALQEFFLKPGLGLLPHTHEDVTAIVVPLKGSLGQKSLKKGSTTISEGEVQLLCYKKDDMHIEYNLNKMKNLDCLVYVLASKNNKNSTEVFKLKKKKNTIQKIFNSNINEGQKETVNFYLGTYKKNIQETYTFKNEKKGVIIYMASGKITLTKNNQTLKKRDTYAVWNDDSISFTTNKKSKFFILEITS